MKLPRGGAVVAVLVLLGGSCQTQLVAQQPLYSQPGYWQPGPYGQPAQFPQSAQYAPAQPGYGSGYAHTQPGYAPSQSYSAAGPGAVQGYAQLGYAQPGYAQPPAYAQPNNTNGYGANGYGYSQPQGPAQSPRQPLGAPQLEQLAAPIALYPDTLVAQVLAAATYPAQVLEADRWLRAQGNASAYDIAGGADEQSWDPSVKSLTAFPQVLAELARNINWTTDLGNAYYNQPQDLLEAVQVLRQRAEASGSLQSTPHEAVTFDQGNIELAPVDPQMVYVPAYDPWTVYGDPVTPYPGFSLWSALGSFFTSGLGSSLVQYGLGTALSAFAHTTWGWLGWGLSWLGHAVLFHHSAYASQSVTVADWGFPAGGPRAFAPGAGGLAGSASLRQGGRYAATPAPGYARAPERPQRSAYSPAAQTPSRPGLEAYNRVPAPIVRSQQNSARPDRARLDTARLYTARPGSSAGYAAGPAANSGVRAGSVYANSYANSYANPSLAYRAPTATLPRSGYEPARPSGGYSGQSFAGSFGFAGSVSGGAVSKDLHSGGFHPFGGGNEAKLKEPKYSEPKFKEPKFKEPKFKEPKFKEPKYSAPKCKEPKMASSHSSGGHSSGKRHG